MMVSARLFQLFSRLVLVFRDRHQDSVQDPGGTWCEYRNHRGKVVDDRGFGVRHQDPSDSAVSSVRMAT